LNPKSGKPKQATLATRALDATERFLQRVSEHEGPARRLIHMVHLLVVGVRRSQLTRMAAALSYRTIFGLIPVLVIGFMVIATFASEDQVKDVIHKLFSFAGLTEVVAHNEDAAAAAASDGQALSLDKWMSGIFLKIQQLPKGTIGIIGAIALIYAAISMLVEIEKAFNQIYNAPEGRSWVRRITQYWTLLTLGTLFLIGSFYAQERITGLADAIQLTNSLESFRTTALHILSFVVPVCISTVLLVIVFMIVPNTRVLFMPALTGAGLSAILWEAGKFGFRLYVAQLGKSELNRVYGAVILLPLFLFWVYITWLIVLAGLQLASALQAHRLTNMEGFHFSVLATFGLVDEERAKHNVKIVDPASVLVVLIAVAERFAGGKPSDHSHVATATGLDEQAVADMLERLAGAGLLLRVLDAEREGTYALARPPEAIPAVEALALSQELVGNSRAAENKVLLSLSRARVAALEGKTVADLMERPHVAPPVVSDPVPPAAAQGARPVEAAKGVAPAKA
jgi:membrane protein